MSQIQDTATALGIAVVANVPVLLWGPPGQGKTSVIEQLARDYGLPMETVIASVREPSDFAGLPVVDDITKSVTLAPPSWARRLADAGHGIQFYDEISTAPPATQAALLRPILSGWVGDLKLPDPVRTIGAANPADIAAGGWDLAPPMANRFLHLFWTLDAAYVREGFSVGWPTIELPTPDEARVADLFKEAKMLIGAFLSTRPEHTTNVPASSEESTLAWPSPRSWEQAAKLYAFAQAAGCNSNVVTLLISGSVGVTVAGEFTTFLASLDLPDPEKLLADPDSLVLDAGRGDKVYAIAASVWSATASNNTPERWINCGRVLTHIANANHGDIAYVYARHWGQNRPQGAMPTQESVAALGPMLTELGLLEDEV